MLGYCVYRGRYLSRCSCGSGYNSSMVNKTTKHHNQHARRVADKRLFHQIKPTFFYSLLALLSKFKRGCKNER